MTTLTGTEQTTLAAFGRRFPRHRGPLTLDTRLREDLGADSLDLVELVFDLEQAFGVPLDEADVADLHTVGDVVRRLEAAGA
jgi:acyl carrier protein